MTIAQLDFTAVQMILGNIEFPNNRSKRYVKTNDGKTLYIKVAKMLGDKNPFVRYKEVC